MDDRSEPFPADVSRILCEVREFEPKNSIVVIPGKMFAFYAEFTTEGEAYNLSVKGNTSQPPTLLTPLQPFSSHVHIAHPPSFIVTCIVNIIWFKRWSE
jgi:hypothetical protein